MSGTLIREAKLLGGTLERNYDRAANNGGDTCDRKIADLSCSIGRHAIQHGFNLHIHFRRSGSTKATGIPYGLKGQVSSLGGSP
jgi:hypothetical protein